MTNDEARATIVEALHRTANVFNDPSISERLKDPRADLPLEALGLDSLDRVEWCIEIEDRTGLTIDPAELALSGTLLDFARRLAERTIPRAE